VQQQYAHGGTTPTNLGTALSKLLTDSRRVFVRISVILLWPLVPRASRTASVCSRVEPDDNIRVWSLRMSLDKLFSFEQRTNAAR